MKAEEDLSQEHPEAPAQVRGKPVKRVALLLSVLMLAVLALLWIRLPQADKPVRPEAPAAQVSAQGDQVLAFDPFLIPLGGTSKYTFISLSFSVELPNGQSGKEIQEKMVELRGVLYDSLKEDFQKAEGIPLIQAVKDGIERAVRRTVPGRQVKDIYFSQFLAL
jgi:flagellar basal body-associated protein FliL